MTSDEAGDLVSRLTALLREQDDSQIEEVLRARAYKYVYDCNYITWMTEAQHSRYVDCPEMLSVRFVRVVIHALFFKHLLWLH